MSKDWLAVENRSLQVGEEAETWFNMLFAEIEKMMQGNLESIPSILELIAGNAALPEQVRDLAEGFLNDQRVSKLRRYLQKLEAVESQTDEKRVYGWPEKAWTRQGDFTPDSFALSLSGTASAARGVAFTVMNDADPFDDPFAEARLDLNGQLSAGLGIQGAVGAIGIGVDASAMLQRAIAYDMQFVRETKTFQAIAYSLKVLGRRLDNYDAMLEAFADEAPGRLVQVRYTGAQQLGLAAKGSVAIPLQGAGTVGLGFSSGINTGSNFIVQVDPAENATALRVRAKCGSSSARKTELSVTYQLGIADLSAGLVKEIAKRLADVDALLGQLDGSLAEAKAWLKPGSLLKDKLSEEIKSQIGGSGSVQSALKTALGNWIGLGSEADAGSISELVSEELAAAVDDRLDMFDKNVETAALLKDVATRLIGQLGDAAGEKLDGVLSDVGGWLDSEIEEQANALDATAKKQLKKALGHDPDVLVDAVREYLKKTREKVAEIAKGVADGNLELLAAQMAWSRVFEGQADVALDAVVDSSDSGKDFYRRFIRRPEKATSRLLQGSGVSGVSVKKASIAASATSLTEGRWNVALLDLPFGGGGSSLSKVQIVRTRSGVSVGTESRVQKMARLSTDSRTVTFADAMSIAFIDSDDAEQREVARISLDLTHIDGSFFGGWSRKEVKNFIEGFRDAGMLDESVLDALLTRYNSIRETTGAQTVSGSLSAVLAIPPELASLMIKRASGPDARALVAEAVAVALLADDESRVAFAQAVADALVAVRKSARNAFLASGGANDLGDDRFGVVPVQALMAIDAEFVKEVRRSTRNSSDSSKILSPIQGAFKALESLRQYLDFLSHVRESGRRAQAASLSVAQLEDLRDQLLDENRDHVKALKRHWVKSGGLPLFASPPRRTVALFRVLRFLSQRTLSLPAPPPVIIRFEPEGLPPTFYSVERDDDDES